MCTNKIRGFTLVEILVAASVFSLFFMGVFNLYRMGTNMFVTGSWKLHKQKEAERFLSQLRERLEQAAPASVVTDAEVAESTIHIYTLANNTSVTEPAADTRLILFSVCKPAINNATTNTEGLLMPHILKMRKSTTNELSTLTLEGNTTIDFPGINGDFLNELNAGQALGNQDANPEDYGLGSENSFFTKLTEVTSVTIFWGAASGTIDASSDNPSGQTLGIGVTMRNPKHPQTELTQTIYARINDAAPLMTRSIDDL